MGATTPLQVVATIAALPSIQQGFELGHIPPERAGVLGELLLLLLLPGLLLLLLLVLVLVLELPPLLAVLLHRLVLRGAEARRQQSLGVQGSPRPGAGDLLLQQLGLVGEQGHHGLAEHAQADLGHGALEGVLRGQAVVEALVRGLRGADQQAVVGGDDAIAQLHLRGATLRQDLGFPMKTFFVVFPPPRFTMGFYTFSDSNCEEKKGIERPP